MSTKQASSNRVRVGDVAPDFTLSSQAGGSVHLGDFLGKQAVVLYFYPKDDTLGCTAEACSFRDSYQDFKEAGAEVIGVSSDSVESHDRFTARHRLPFLLVSDQNGELRRRYGVPRAFGVLPGRVTYVIDKSGVVRHVFESQLGATKHIREALTVLQGLERSTR